MVKAKERVKYDNSTTIVCPSCGEDVHVGSAGPAGLAQHEGKGPCRKAQAKKEQQKKTRTLVKSSVKKTNDIPASMPAAAGSSSRNKWPPPIVVVQTPQGLEVHYSATEPGGQVRRGCERGWELMTKLKEAEDRMDANMAMFFLELPF